MHIMLEIILSTGIHIQMNTFFLSNNIRGNGIQARMSIDIIITITIIITIISITALYCAKLRLFHTQFNLIFIENT